MRPCYLWTFIILFTVLLTGCATTTSYNDLTDRHYDYTSGEKQVTLEEWHTLITALEQYIRSDSESQTADETQYAIASSWVWCIKAGDSEAPQRAISAFRKLIYTYPDSKHLPQAHYWLAKCYTLIEDTARAVHHYQIVIDRYEDSELVAAAKLALGHTYSDEGYETRAKTLYVDIIETATQKDIVTTATEKLEALKSPEKTAAPHVESPPKLQPVVIPTPHKNDIEALPPERLTQEFGLSAKTIVIDAGHGGKDPGGGTGDMIEKPIALSISKKVGAIFNSKGYTVLFTRSTDRYIPLKERTDYATRHKADLFLSIHANASVNPNANGIETYYLDVTSTDKDAELIAARENANSGYSIQELESLLKGLIIESKSEDSRRLATHVQKELVAATGAVDRGVKHARFVVLIGTRVPAILIETGFVTNPTEGKKLTSEAYQQKLADAIFSGVEKFLGNIQQISKNTNQVHKFLTTKR